MSYTYYLDIIWDQAHPAADEARFHACFNDARTELVVGNETLVIIWKSIDSTRHYMATSHYSDAYVKHLTRIAIQNAWKKAGMQGAPSGSITLQKVIAVDHIGNSRD
jgi:hypothetical protein